MQKFLLYCPLVVVAFAWQLWTVQALLVDRLVKQSSIYYQANPTELPLSSVEQVSTLTSVKLIVHGFTGSRHQPVIQPLIKGYVEAAYENILVADWAPAANLDYVSSRYAVSKVAVELARQLQAFLERFGIAKEAVHVVGHSLGAHIAGGIGKYFNGSLSRVTGLDPALPLFLPGSEDGLQANAAQFVDVIHTDFPFFGDITPRGNADFYPNFGYAPQPGCESLDLETVGKLVFQSYSCSHNRAVSFFAESIGSPQSFPAIPCSWKGIQSRKVSLCPDKLASGEDKTSQDVYMGEQATRGASESSFFYLETNAAPPFGQGAQASDGSARTFGP